MCTSVHACTDAYHVHERWAVLRVGDPCFPGVSFERTFKSPLEQATPSPRSPEKESHENLGLKDHSLQYQQQGRQHHA